VSSSGRISPTAHYTGYVWVRNGLSHPALTTREGRLLFEAERPIALVGRLLGGASLESYLLVRHLAIDALLERAIEEGGITQVIEIAAGLSARGWRFTERYGDRITYLEADLPEMAARKRRALTRIGSISARHRVEALDALSDEGPSSVGALALELDSGQGLAIITEGLLGYLPRDAVERMWRRFAQTLGDFAHGRYISDLHIGSVQSAQVRAFRILLSALVRGRVHVHFHDPSEATAALVAAGFRAAGVHRAADLAPQARGPGSELVHILEASTE
jgi:O-methyltransferase involved in polyketide biosynthesis